jgi:succinate dehydrogenase / fumarate reductase cytochrome b subunit
MAAPSVLTAPIDKPTPSRWIARFFNSTIGGKYLVAITGLLLTAFVIAHLIGNLQIFLGREAYNSYAYGLKKMGPLLWLARGALLATLVLHVFLSLRFKKRNLDARPVPYVYERSKRATVSSRYMWLTGILVLLFILFHLAHFTFGWVDRVEDRDRGTTISYLELKDPTDPARADTYRMFIDGFRNVPVSLLYIAFMIVLGLHLIHGVRSSFQSLGINSAKVNSGLNMLGDAVTIVVVTLNILMPVAVMMRWVGADV